MEADTYSEVIQLFDDRPPHDGKNLGWLFGMVFGVRPGTPSLVFPPEHEPVVTQAVETALLTLTPREEKVIRMRLGLPHNEIAANNMSQIISMYRVTESARSNAKRCGNFDIHRGRAA